MADTNMPTTVTSQATRTTATVDEPLDLQMSQDLGRYAALIPSANTSQPVDSVRPWTVMLDE